MSSLLEDLDELMWPIKFKLDQKISRAEYYDLVDWCNIQFGMNGWWMDEKYYMRLKKEEHRTLFILRWL